jgi:hypothetical protein
MLSATSAEPNIYRTEMIFSRSNAQQAPPQPATGNDSAHSTTARRFPPPWIVNAPDMKLGQDCFIVRDANGQALAYVCRQEKMALKCYEWRSANKVIE